MYVLFMHVYCKCIGKRLRDRDMMENPLIHKLHTFKIIIKNKQPLKIKKARNAPFFYTN